MRAFPTQVVSAIVVVLLAYFAFRRLGSVAAIPPAISKLVLWTIIPVVASLIASRGVSRASLHDLGCHGPLIAVGPGFVAAIAAGTDIGGPRRTRSRIGVAWLTRDDDTCRTLRGGISVPRIFGQPSAHRRHLNVACNSDERPNVRRGAFEQCLARHNVGNCR